ncbi:hypothetical protein [Microbacterium sp. JZ31]|uniref:hypothetical protein n=1 Tax=Microbacterium sp. JZ31 TaxID=1906274 RepID=UPI001933B8F2|nr:hypothetical protein [Microbacterium sp. JZ31]
MSRAATWLTALGIAIAACVVNALTPHAHLAYSTATHEMPFDVPMAIGETTHGRTFSARPTAVRSAHTIETDDEERFEGTFLIVDLMLDATGAEAPTLLQGVQLETDGRTYFPVPRIPGTLESATLRAGLPVTGSLVFELPEDGIQGRAQLRLSKDVVTRFDDRLVLDIDLGAVEVAPVETVERSGWAG